MSSAINIAGQRFGKLIALAPTNERKDKKVVWSFRCDCGAIKNIVAKEAKAGNTSSCGCLGGDVQRALSIAKQVAKTCPICFKGFFVKLSRALKSTYCSRVCMAEAYRNLMVGAGNPNYKAVTDDDRKALAKRWREANPDKVSERNRASRAARRGATGRHTAKDVAAIRDRQAGLCAACKCGLHGEGHVDHIIPIKRGGCNFVGNIQLLCAQCNLRKKTMLPIEYRHRVLKGVTEDAEQSRLIAWASSKCDELPELVLLYHAANGGYRTKATAARMQMLGVKRGVPDLILPVGRGGYGGCYIELKVGKNKPTPEQAAWLSALNACGNYAVVAVGWEAARAVLEWYLSMPDSRQKCV